MINTSIPLSILNQSNKGNLAGSLGIEFIESDPTFLRAKMPVNENTIQQLGMLSGGASAALAETTGSLAAYLSIERDKFYCLGLEMKINHLKSVTEGFIYAKAEPVHVGKTTHVWQIRNTDETGDLISLAILTMAILPLNEQLRQAILSRLSGLI